MSASPSANLLVPIVVDALAVGTPTGKWANLAPDFANKYAQGHILGYQQLPTPSGLWHFSTQPYAPPGIHVRWSLPDGLTHALTPSKIGSPDKDEQPSYPAVPNRWLVIRMYSTGSPSAPQLKAWIVESDAVQSAKPQKPSSQWPVFPDSTTHGISNDDSVVYVGRSLEFSNWPDAFSGIYVEEKFGSPLTAVGYGEPTYAACHEHSKGVFSFHDDSLDTDFPNASTTDQAQLAYFVAGWYADPDKDPLYGIDTVEAWKTAMDQFAWTCPDSGIESPGQDPQPLPERIVCHGLISKIQWQGSSHPYDPPTPDDTDLQVAVGNTSLEALAALIANNVHQKSPSISEGAVFDTLIAFQLDLLASYQKGGQANPFDRELAEALHTSSFSSTQGGTIWNIERKTSEANTPNNQLPNQGALPPATPFPPEIQQNLNLLNQAQRELDESSRLLESTQKEYFKAWHVKTDGVTVSTSVFSDLEQQIGDHSQAIGNHQADIDRLASKLKQQLLPQLLDTHELKSQPAARFWQAQDPVVLLAGAGRTYRHGEDGRFNQIIDDVGSPGSQPANATQGKLLCRIESDLLGGFRIQPKGGNELTVQSSDIQIAFPTHGTGTGSPADFDTSIEPSIHSLLIESILLDPLEAPYLASFVADHAGVPVAEVIAAIQKQQGIQWNAPSGQGYPPVVNFLGIAPSQAAITYWTDSTGNPSNPWIPINLQWQAKTTPSYASYKGIPKALDDWTFNGIEYDRTPSSPLGSSSSAYAYNHFTSVTPSAIWTLEQRLFLFLTDWAAKGIQPSEQEDFDLLEKILGQLQSLDILSQTIGNLSENQGMQRSSLQLPPIHFTVHGQSAIYTLATSISNPAVPIAPLIDHRYEIGAIPNYNNELEPQTPTDDSWFFPLRAGNLEFSNLAIIDAFGQVLNPSKLPDPIFSLSLKSDCSNTQAEIRPRLAQPARLGFRFVSANDDFTETNSDPGTTPVLGWIWTNHLDRSILLSNNNGRILGKFRLSADQSSVLWIPDPQVSGSTESSPAAPVNPELQSFQDGLLAQSGRAYLEFINYINQAQDQILVPGSRQGDLSSLLMGPPLALVRASLQLEIGGRPLYDQSKEAIGQFEDRGYTNIPFKITLGDLGMPNDSLYGFFKTDNQSDDYTTFYTAYGANADAITGPYVNVPSTNDTPVQLSLNSGSSPASPQFVTLLMDPRASVKAQTGILPAKIIEVPQQDIQALLASHEIFFQVSPIISSQGAFSMPRPSESFGQWTWLYQSGAYDENKQWSSEWKAHKQFGQQTASGTLPAYPLSLQEGWLKLITPGSGGAGILSFGVSGGTYQVPSGSEIQLTWSSILPSGFTLKLSQKGSASESVPNASVGHPVTILADTEFSLTLKDPNSHIVDFRSFEISTIGSP